MLDGSETIWVARLCWERHREVVRQKQNSLGCPKYNSGVYFWTIGYYFDDKGMQSQNETSWDISRYHIQGTKNPQLRIRKFARALPKNIISASFMSCWDKFRRFGITWHITGYPWLSLEKMVTEKKIILHDPSSCDDTCSVEPVL